MRKAIYILAALLLLTAAGVHAQVADGKVTIEEVTVTGQDTTVTVSFRANIDRRAVGRSRTLVFAPVLTDGTYRVSLPQIVVRGRGVAATSARREWAAGQQAEYNEPVYAKPGDRITYKASAPLQQWMHGARLVIESVVEGCCSSHTADEAMMAENIMPQSLPSAQTESVTPQTTGDVIAESFPFVRSSDEFNPQEPFAIYDDERENALIVYYRVAKSQIDPIYMDNSRTLNDLTSAVNTILRSPDSSISCIVIGGFASPEGSYQINERLGYERATAVKEYVARETGMTPANIIVHNGGVDWSGLRLFVEKSNMPWRHRVIDIIDSAPASDAGTHAGKLHRLRALDNGVPYRHMLREFFPYLRNGAFIKVYYRNK